MSDNQTSPTPPEDNSECVDKRNFFERMWCKIDPLGSAYPVWIALLLITLILLFALALRFEFDISQLGWK